MSKATIYFILRSKKFKQLYYARNAAVRTLGPFTTTPNQKRTSTIPQRNTQTVHFAPTKTGKSDNLASSVTLHYSTYSTLT